MNRSLVLSLAALASGMVATQVQAQDIFARVISSTPVIQQVAVPYQNCSSTPVVVQAPNSGAGAVLGALAGGALGNAVGGGSGRAAATVLGLVGGAVVGNNIEGANAQVQNVQRCSTQTTYENRVAYYDVVYEYANQHYNVRMPNDPGQSVRLQVSPVGAVAAQAPEQQAYYVQPAPPTTVYYGPPVYPYPYYRPYYAPIGFSFNLGYGRHHRF